MRKRVIHLATHPSYAAEACRGPGHAGSRRLRHHSKHLDRGDQLGPDREDLGDRAQRRVRRAARPRRQCAGQPRDGRAAQVPLRRCGPLEAGPQDPYRPQRHLPHQGDRAGQRSLPRRARPGAGLGRRTGPGRVADGVPRRQAPRDPRRRRPRQRPRPAGRPPSRQGRRQRPGRPPDPRHQLPSTAASASPGRASRPGIYRLRAFAARNRKAIGGSSARRRITVYRYAAASWYGPGLYGNTMACGGTLTPATLGVANKYAAVRHQGQAPLRGPHCHGAGDRPRAIRRGSRVRPHLRHQAAARVPRHRLRAARPSRARASRRPRRSWSASLRLGARRRSPRRPPP